MTITSFDFLLFLLAGGICYYILPKSWQWIELLALSLIFYCLVATPYTLIFILISTGTAWVATNMSLQGRPGILAGAAIFIDVLLWLALKGSSLWVSVSQSLQRLLPFALELKPLPIAAALGMGYYTLQIIGYILDCCWGTAKPQKNIVKLLLFLLFFPQLITGPISRYNELEGLYQKHSFSYVGVTRGVQRILWGFTKKLVLAERLVGLVDKLWINVGYYRWIALLLFPLQMYADFSGGMDIVIGTAEIFGIRLSENFKTPFLSRTVQEFWQRWHITLGIWAKDYVLYPFLKSNFIIALGKKTRKYFGKRVGKMIPTAIGMFVLWMVIGIWHGELRYIAGTCVWYWAILMMGEICTPFLEKMSNFLHIQRDCFSWRLFQSVRTYIVVAVGTVFFRTDIREGFYWILDLRLIFLGENPNIWIFFDGSLAELAGGRIELYIIMLSAALLLIAAILREKFGSAREWIARQGIVFRWAVWLGLFLFVLIFGMYGPGYDAAEFIYEGF